MSIVRNTKIATIVAASTGVVITCSLTVTGAALAPVKFGSSFALCVLAGVAGELTSAAGAVAGIAGAVLAKKELKKAQQHINLDQQLSLSINKVADMYSEIMKHKPQHAAALEEAVGGKQGLTTSIGVEGKVEASALAICSTGYIAGMALAGPVSVPIDISSIAYNSFHIYKAKQDEAGKAEKNIEKWLNKEIEKLFRGSKKCKIKQSCQ